MLHTHSRWSSELEIKGLMKIIIHHCFARFSIFWGRTTGKLPGKFINNILVTGVKWESSRLFERGVEMMAEVPISSELWMAYVIFWVRREICMRQNARGEDSSQSQVRHGSINHGWKGWINSNETFLDWLKNEDKFDGSTKLAGLINWMHI